MLAMRLPMPTPVRHAVAASFTALALSLCGAAPPAQAAVDANQASQADLESVRGIGPALSGKILAARQMGAFKGWDDLLQRVAGIGAGNASRLSQAGLTVAGNAFAGQPVAERAPRARRGDTAPAAAPATAPASAAMR